MPRSAWLLLAAVASSAAAHPVDEMVQNAYLTLAPGEVRMELQLTPGADIAAVMLRSLDANGDRSISKGEAWAYGRRVLGQSTLSLDGRPTEWRLERVVAPPYRNLRFAADTLKIHAVARRPDRAGKHALRFRNHYRAMSSRCTANIFLRPGSGWRYRVTGQRRSNDGRLLTVLYAAAPAPPHR